MLGNDRVVEVPRLVPRCGCVHPVLDDDSKATRLIVGSQGELILPQNTLEGTFRVGERPDKPSGRAYSDAYG